MKQIEVYTTQQCPYCVRAKALLAARGLAYDEIDVSRDMARMEEMIVRSGRRTVQQIFIDNEAIGGFDELSRLHTDGKLF